MMRRGRRVLLATWDGGGNIPPFTALARALAARGDEVVVLGHGTTREVFERAGCTFVEWVSTTQPRNHWEFMAPAEDMAYAVEHIFYNTSYQDDLRRAIEDLAPDVVVADVLLNYAIIESLRAPTPLWVLCHIAFALAASGGDVTEPHFAELTRVAASDGVPEFSSRRAMLDMADGVVVTSYEAFDPLPVGDVGPNVLHVGPLRPPSASSTGWQRRSPDKPFVLVSSSTSAQTQAPLLQRLCDACGQLDIEALVTTGRALASGTLTTAANVTAVDFVDHGDVLPQADLVVTHAGLGTVLAALAHGVPMLCTPLGRDQPFNARRVAELGMGTTLDAKVTTDELRDAIQNMLNNREARQHAAKFKQSLSTQPGIDDALQAIDRTIDTN